MSLAGRWDVARCAIAITVVVVAMSVGATQNAMAPPVETPAAVHDTTAPMRFVGGFLRETRIVYPLLSDGWTAVDAHRYEDQRYGVSVRDAHGDDRDRWIDLYCYPAGVLDAAAAAERDGIAGVIGQPGGYTSVAMGELRRFALPVPQSKAAPASESRDSGFSIDMRLERDGCTKHSAMTFLVDRLYVVKARLSLVEPMLSRDDARTQLDQFIAALLQRLTISSSGGRWMPLPIARLSGDAKAPGALMQGSLGKGPPCEFLLQERVPARDPESSGARCMMVAGMAPLGRLFPDCESAEPLNPDVPDGMREIRIEYRAPQEDSTSPRTWSIRPSGCGTA